MTTVTQDRITVYRIPPDTVHSLLPSYKGQQFLSDTPMEGGLYANDPSRSCPGHGLLCLTPIDHETSCYHHVVQVKDVERFAQTFAPEDHLLPQDGKCFMGLNFSESDFSVVQHAVELACSECAELDTEGALTAICSEYLQRHNGDHLSCPSPRSELGCPGPAAGGFDKIPA